MQHLTGNSGGAVILLAVGLQIQIQFQVYFMLLGTLKQVQSKSRRDSRVRQEVGEAEGGTAWCIPLQMTHSVTSP